MTTRRGARTPFLALAATVLLGQAALAQVITGPSQMDQCDQATFTIAFTNLSPTQTACRIVITNALPNPNFVYVPGSGRLTPHSGAPVTFSPTAGSWDVDVLLGYAYALPVGKTLTVAFDLRTTCGALSGNDEVDVQYEDCDVPGSPTHATDSLSVEILPGAITVTKTPAVAPAGFDDLVTWTLEIRSTGLGSIQNVVAWDVLGPGLTYVSSSPAGSVVGQTITWNSSSVAAFVRMPANTLVTISLAARVTACSGLENRLDARFGCAEGEECDNTVTDPNGCGCGTATASVQFVERLPFLSFPPPSIAAPYCTSATVHLPITNSGDGTAHEGILCANLSPLLVTNVQGGASYDGTCFHLPDIAAGTVFDLAFDVAYSGNWCAGGPSGTSLFTLDYTNDCGIQHHASPQFGSIGTSAGPSLSVSKTGPAVAKIGSSVTYGVTASYSGPTSCGSGTMGPVTVTDQIPAGFTVSSAGGGAWTPGGDGTGGTITWTFASSTPGGLDTSVTLEVPLLCSACHTIVTNAITAQAMSCCGCALSASSSVRTSITCEALYTSTFSFSPSSVLERCGTPVTFTDRHTFDNDAVLDTVEFSDFTYYVIKDGGLAYVSGTARVWIDGQETFAFTAIDGSGRLLVVVTDPRSVRNRTLTYEYRMQATAASGTACGGSPSFPLWTYHEIWPVGTCTESYDTASLSVEAPAMSVGITGVPTIQEDCATYSPTVTLRRTSATAAPYDVRIVVRGNPYVLAALALGTWSGITPVAGPNVGSDGSAYIEWLFADGFGTPGASATLSVPITVPCGGDLLSLSAQAFFDDRCSNISGYNNTCSTSASAASSLRLTGDLYITKTPEVFYTTVRTVTWRIEVYNASNGTAYNAYVDDVLGSGLVYSSSSVSGHPGSVVTRPNLDHTGAAINGASFLFDQIAPGERPVITFTANLVACHGMTNVATVGWGCGGQACQPTRSDSSSVLVPPANLVATSYAPTPLDACQNEKATITVKSTGIASTYHVTATATLPAGMLYAGGAEYRVNAGGWLPTGDPGGSPGPTLAWTEAQVPTLAVMASGVTVDIRFEVSVNCSFTGGALRAQAGYQNPCGQTLTSAVGSFYIAARTPTLSLTTTQVAPAAGQPIPCGGDVTREIRVTNSSGSAPAPVVWVEDTLGAGFTYVSSTGGADGGWNSGQVTTWEILNLAAGATATLTLVAHSTSGPGSCDALTSTVRSYWGCGPDGNSATPPDCRSATSSTASYSGTRRPTVAAAVTLSPSSISACQKETTFTLTLTNASSSAPAYSPDAKVTLPAGLSYRAGTTEVDCGTGFSPAADPVQAGQVLTWYNAATTGPGNDLCSSVPAGGSVAVRFQVDASCYRTTGSAAIDLSYYDCCGATQHHATSSRSIGALPPSLTLAVTPATAALDCGDPLNETTWTITVTNASSTTAAEFVRVEETLGADLLRVSGGAQIGTSPKRWGWEFGPLGPGASRSETFSVRLVASASDCALFRRQGSAQATWGCGSFDGEPNTVEGCAGTTVGPVTAMIVVPDLVVSNLVATCRGDDSYDVTARVENAGQAAAGGVSVRLYVDATLVSSTFTDLAMGQVYSFSALTPAVRCGIDHGFRLVVDEPGGICECSESNNEARVSASCPCPPALFVDKVVTEVLRAGASVGTGRPLLYGDVVLYRVTVRNVGTNGAYGVEIEDTLPTGLVYTTASPLGAGTYAVSSPQAGGTLGIREGATSFVSALSARIAGAGSLVVSYAARVTGVVLPGVDLVNTVSARGRDAGGTEIPPTNPDVGDSRPDVAEAVVRVGAPALVTEKTVASISRAGANVGRMGSVVSGDAVTYRLKVRNVGEAPALDVCVTDDLPDSFVYVPGTAEIVWPGGGSVADPWDVTSPHLDFPLHTRLEPGEALILTLQARVTGPIEAGISYTNTLRATGIDLVGNAIPADNHSRVPNDTDFDDSARVALPGAAGPAAAPVLRKTAESRALAGCVGPGAVADRIWFQTDIALYASYELDELATRARLEPLSPASLLPTWTRTAAELGASVSLNNLLQVAALSQVGVGLEWGPRVARVARESGKTKEAALDVLLARYAEEAGLLPAERPRNERWITIELEGGDPRYATRDHEEPPSGTWPAYEETIRASAVGMGFLAGAREAERLLGSASPLDRYRGLVLAEAIANKLELLDQRIARPVTEGTLRTIPTACTAVFKERVLGFEVRDETSLLFDQVSLLFGLSEVLTFLEEAQRGAYAGLAPFGAEYRDLAQKLLLEVLRAVRLLHRGATGDVAETWSPTTGRGPAPSSLLRGLLGAALERAAPFAGEPAVALLREQSQRLLVQVGQTGAWEDDPIGELSLVRGLLAAYGLVGNADLLAAAERAFDRVVDTSWDERIGFFRGWEELPCVTPLEVGVAIGALREVALHSDAVRSDRAGRVLSRILDGIVKDAALQLDYALPNGVAPIRDEDEETWPLVLADAPLGVAPVLQETICLQTPPLSGGCVGWRPVDREPWYQTDLAMYAAFAIQENLSFAEDIADANLASLDLFSGLGISLGEGPLVEGLARSTNVTRGEATKALRGDLARRAGREKPGLPEPTTIPFYAASPRLPGTVALAWDPATFDRKVTGSALGMTLLREAQEALALLSTHTSAEDGGTASESEYALLLLASIADKLLLLDEVSRAMERSAGVAYVPHAISLTPSPERLKWELLNAGSDLFDQISLLFGLAETYRLLSSPVVADAPGAFPGLARVTPALVLDLSTRVLEVLAEAHADPILGSLVDRTALQGGRWVREAGATTTLLGLAVSALDRAADALPTEQAEKALGLLTIETEFLRQGVAQGLRNRYPIGPDEACPCGGPDLASSLAVIEALVIGAGRGRDPSDLDCAQGTFDLLEATLWDASTDLYLPGLDPEGRCYTPLDLGLAASALEKLARASEPLRAEFIRERLRATFTGLADAARLQLSEVLDESKDDVDRPFAPVLARRVCLVLRGAGKGETSEGGEPIRYTVTVDNPTQATWTSLVLEDVLPAGVAFVSADPATQVDGSRLRWPFDQLLPGESRSYSVLGTIEPGPRPAENCAVLAYADEVGTPQPPLRACAGAAAEAAPPTLEKTGVEVVVPSYETEGAMLLSYVLEQVALQAGTAFSPADRARTYSRANLKVLLGESGLGIPLVSIGTENVAATLAALAAGAGLEAVPSLPLPIYIPFEGGDPRHLAGEGFVHKDERITSRAVGATLARAALVLEERDMSPQGLFWTRFVDIVARNGIAWLALSSATDPTGAARLPAVVSPDGEILDPEGRVRDDAVLLLGLSEIALADPAEVSARDLAWIVLDSLAAHRDLGGQWRDGEALATWADLGWVAIALERASEAVPDSREVADTLLADLVQAASDTGPLADPIAEAGRIRSLLALGATGTGEARAAWETFRVAFWDETIGVFGFQPGAATEWVYRSGDLALVFEMMRSLAQAVPELAEDLLGRMAATFERVVERGRLQLVLPIEPRPCCGTPGGPRYGIAPVFGRETTLDGWALESGLGDVEPLDVALFRIKVTPSGSSPLGALVLSDCPGEGLMLVPGSAQIEEGLESRRVFHAGARPLTLALQGLTGPATASYLLIAGPDAPAEWQNEACGTWIDPTGRSRSVRSQPLRE